MAMLDQSMRRAEVERSPSAAVIVDVAGAQMGGAARFKAELDRYLSRNGRDDVEVIGSSRRVSPAWLLRRELECSGGFRRYVSLNNVGFVRPGGERWALLRNALHFLTDSELSKLDPAVHAASMREARVVRIAARRSHVLVTPSTAMANRVASALPRLRTRIQIRPHPVSADAIPSMLRDPAILCPVLFSPYKHMAERLGELLAAIDACGDSSVRLRITAERTEVPADLASNPRIDVAGRLSHADLRTLWARSKAIYFPTGIESFGYPLAEARACGWPVIARDTPQNREIANSALCGFTPGDPVSLRAAVEFALNRTVEPEPDPFDPETYFDWLLGPSR
jgi:glycosyltransferase involved in cell wall biosynthesis